MKQAHPFPETEETRPIQPGKRSTMGGEPSPIQPVRADMGLAVVEVPAQHTKFATYTWIVLLYNLAAVAWGVFVRASSSGDGCGSHWPLCDGDSVPMNGPISKIIEGSHRASTGLIGVFVFAMLLWAWKSFPRGHQARFWSAAAMGFTIMEGLIGAALVKFGWVTMNDSAGRAGAMSFHVVSTFLLLSSLVLAAVAAQNPGPIRLRGQGPIVWMLVATALSVVLLAVSGAISALGHQLKPVTDVIAAAANPNTHWMVRLQPYHPYLALAIGLYVVLVAGLVIHMRPDPRVQFAARLMVWTYSLQLGLGWINILLKAPIWLQMVHLVVADLCFLSIVGLAAYALLDGVPRRDDVFGPPTEDRPHGKDLIKAYVGLTKPRVISLLLFTTLTAMFAAAGGWPGGWLLLATAIGGYMSAGAANVINMVIDRDIDGAMKRTSKRPTVTQSIPSHHVLIFGLTLALGSFGLLWFAANLLSATLALSGLVFYVNIYTLMLKRRTWQNIVIGGAAGAFPPLVGWAAVSNSLTPLAWFLFAVIFVWTPVHFWALALLIKEDYAKAGVPMLPVVRGERATAIQIGAYGIVTAVVTILPPFYGQAGWLYVSTAVVLNIILLVRCAQLFKTTDRPHAVILYKFSMLYLAILFTVIAVDQAMLARGVGAVKTARVVSQLDFSGATRELARMPVFQPNSRRSDCMEQLNVANL